MWNIVIGVVRFSEQVVLIYFLFINGWYLLLLVNAFMEMRGHILSIRGENRKKNLSSPLAPTISMLAPAFNEATTIVESVKGLLGLYYSNLEVIIINDGSKDDTIEILKTEFSLKPIYPIYNRRIFHEKIEGLYRSTRHNNLIVIDKANGGKADALNAGLNIANGELVCAIDADTIIEFDALQRMVRPFLDRRDIVAAGGTIRIVNNSTVKGGRVIHTKVPRAPLAGFQVIEYLRAFLFGRLGWNRLGGNLIISGAFGLFRKDEVIEVGGYLHDTVGEDMELVLSLRRQGYEKGRKNRVDFIPDPVAWTEAPETTAVLGRQRDRWHRGLADVLFRHKKVFFNPAYGALGLVVFPYFVIFELLAPIVEIVGLITLLLELTILDINQHFAILFFLLAYGLGTTLTVLTILLEEISFHRYQGLRDRLWLIAWAIGENLGYRQLTVIWRLNGIWKYIRGKTDWGTMERKGFKTSEPADSQQITPTTL